MTRRFQIRSQKSNQTTFDPFWPKEWSKTGLCQFSTVSLPKKGVNVVRFKFETGFEILSSFAAYNLLFLMLSNFNFFGPQCNFKISNGPCGQIFLFEIFDVRFRISIPKCIEMGGVAIALPKKGDHNLPYCNIPARWTKYIIFHFASTRKMTSTGALLEHICCHVCFATADALGTAPNMG